MKQIVCVLLLLVLAVRAEWTPPEKPDPNGILREAQEDAKAERFEDALAKQLWFHDNALHIQPALYGVRLSFALSAWLKLGEKYPPALQALRDVREGAEAEVKAPEGTVESLHDAIALNRTLSEPGRTVALFKWVDEHKPDQAKRAATMAQAALIDAKEYKLCGKYLDFEKDYQRLVELYRSQLKMAKDEQRFAMLRNLSEKSFSASVATLVALLVVNERQAEALEIQKKALQEWNDDSFRNRLDRALQGEFPSPGA